MINVFIWFSCQCTILRSVIISNNIIYHKVNIITFILINFKLYYTDVKNKPILLLRL